MTATYTNQPGTRPIDTVRFEVFDTDTTTEANALLSDQEIQYLIDSNVHVLLAAAAAADVIGAKYAGDPTLKMVGDLQVQYGQGRSAPYKALSATLRRRAGEKVKVFAGGLSVAEKESARNDTDRVQPKMRVGMDDHRGSGTSNDRGLIDY